MSMFLMVGREYDSICSDVNHKIKDLDGTLTNISPSISRIVRVSFRSIQGQILDLIDDVKLFFFV